jgi:hypothetical protein
VNDIEKLWAIEEIKNLKARYFRCVDTKDWPGFQAVFAPDGRLDFADDVAGRVLIGPEIADEVSRLLAGCDSIHHGHCPEIEITSDTTATGIWAMEDLLRWGDESSNQTAHGYGHYFETYEKARGRWYITETKLRRLRVDVTNT